MLLLGGVSIDGVTVHRSERARRRRRIILCAQAAVLGVFAANHIAFYGDAVCMSDRTFCSVPFYISVG